MKRDSANPGAEGGVGERGPEPWAADDTAPARADLARADLRVRSEEISLSGNLLLLNS